MDNFNLLVDYAHKKHNSVVPRERAEIMLLHFGSMLASMANTKVYVPKKHKVVPANFFGMMFLPSGAGKDFVYGLYDDLFNKALSAIPRAISYLATETASLGSRVTEFPPKYDNKINRHYSMGIHGSDIGLYISALAVMDAKFGSLNIKINEFADHIGKTNNIELLKELYDGVLEPKIVQGSDTDEARRRVSGICCNLIAYGSPSSMKEDKGKMTEFKNMSKSGLFRRSIVYYEKPALTIVKEPEDIDVQSIADELIMIPINKKIISKNTVRGSEKYVIEEPDGYIFYLSNEAEDFINTIELELIEKRNENINNEYNAVDMSATWMIINVATIVAYIDMSECIVEKHHLEYAYDLFKRTRATIVDLFTHVADHNKIYNTLSGVRVPLMQTEIIEAIGIDGKSFKANIELVKESAYRDNKVLKETSGKELMRKYWLEELPFTDLSKMVVSVSADNTMAKCTKYRLREIPFYGEGLTIETLIKADGLSFILAHLKPKANGKDNDEYHGHRSDENFISGQNMIAFDVDYGMTLEEAKDAVKEYQYIIYTTRSHRVEKNGVVCDRFRVIMPTATKYFVDVEQHKQMYENLALKLGIPNDPATRNASRLWFTNSEAEVFMNKEGSLIDVRCCLPDTQSEARIKLIEQEFDDSKLDIRVDGYYRWFIRNTFRGNRNDNMFKLCRYMIDLGEDARYHAELLNSKLDEPLSERELSGVLSSAQKK